MPIISGAVWKSNNDSIMHVVENLKSLTSKELESTYYTLYNTSECYFLIAGKKEKESEAEQIVMLRNSGLFVGRLFEKETGKLVNDYNVLAQLLKTDPDTLSKYYWGRYIIALFDKESTAITLWRDPLGLLSFQEHEFAS